MVYATYLTVMDPIFLSFEGFFGYIDLEAAAAKRKMRNLRSDLEETERKKDYLGSACFRSRFGYPRLDILLKSGG